MRWLSLCKYSQIGISKVYKIDSPDFELIV